jgi:hypothetical protein
MHGYLVRLKVGYKSFKIKIIKKMSDDKVIFSMQKLSKTYTEQINLFLKHLFEFLLWS